MSSTKWAEYGWLKAEPTSRDEIKGLSSIVDRDLKDSCVVAISDDRRFEASFHAALTAATIALRSSGYRTSLQPGHHIKTIESLQFTVGADVKLIQQMKTFSKKRNATSYDSAGNVSKQEPELMIKVATQLQQQVKSWLKKNHPELLEE